LAQLDFFWFFWGFRGLGLKKKPRYPAISFKGRAAFNFGPDFKHKAPGFGKTFVAWPGMADGLLRADCPIIGNSNNATWLETKGKGMDVDGICGTHFH